MVSLPGLINLGLLVLIIVGAFLPSPWRPIVILLCCGIGSWVTFGMYSPWEKTPDIKVEEDPPTFFADDLIQRYGVEQTPKNQKIEK